MAQENINMYRQLPTQEYLQSCFLYDKESGSLTWIHRPISHFSSRRSYLSFNAKHEGKLALKGIDHCGYHRGKVDGVTYVAHRVIWKYVTGKDPEFEIDHVDGIRANNAWLNIRSVSHAENMKNTKMRIDNSTGVSGVTIRHGKFCARVQSAGKRMFLGDFETLEKAKIAVFAARIEFNFHSSHGAIVRLV
jgi:hypothetical protein